LPIGGRGFRSPPICAPGLTYATHDGVALQGDLYLPANTRSRGALVAVHGDPIDELGVVVQKFASFSPRVTQANF
jgi:hypothetical protein